MAKIFRIEDKLDKLLGNLQVDISETCKLLDWKLSISIDDGLAATCGAEDGQLFRNLFGVAEINMFLTLY